ncbi:hypothetical protein [Jiulongibacter sediminis]|jgi:hypothetical protein|uniref:Uncharacterized protein n=1 Tax=Jiulongibacter sediminis TaxID=1605367 RepID=A0A0P7BXS3_9BACT|nr:hypothetical protein [Jiulongibacter sediminis]KPM46897.1 hypothetical protein AFM12_16805 [Jiulongibacter sediminis]TBX22246.1 hypothetical protein TK44_16815 [Jiulongibacter sediminis]
MKSLLFLLFFSSFSLLAQERYYFFSGDINNDSQLQNALNSTQYIEVDMDSGELNGVFNSNKFKAWYDIKNTSSGFVKGFNYTLVLGYLQRDVVNSSGFNELTNGLARANRFYFYPDVLAAPRWHFIEIMIPDSPKLVFVRKH